MEKMNNVIRLNNIIRKEIFKSLESKYTSEIQASKSTLMIYFNNSVGIGEHPQHLEEMDQQLNRISEAHDKIEKLHKFFKEYQ